MKQSCWSLVFICAITFLGSLLIQSVHADKLCLQTTVNKKNFKVTSRSIVDSSCPKVYADLADTSTFHGPAGPKDDKCIDGDHASSVSSRCFKRENSASGSGFLSVSGACLVSEYVISSA